MKNSSMLIFALSMAGNIFAADISDLQGLKSSDIKITPAETSITAEAVELPNTAEGPAYKKLKDLFEKGVPATMGDLAHIRMSGRLFTAKDEMFGAFLAAEYIPVRTIANGGPLFDDTAMEFRLLYAAAKTSYYFDNVPPGWPKNSGYSLTQLTIKFPEAVAADPSGSTLILRKSGEYIIGYIEDTHPEHNSYVYFFNKLEP